MKKLIVSLLLLAQVSYAQNVLKWEPPAANPANMPLGENGKIQFREVAAVPDLRSATIIQRAKTWASKYYANANEAIQQVDTAQGILVVKGRLKLKQNVPLNHTLVVDAKDGRYRATISELVYSYEITTPVRAVKEYELKPYGLTADDWYDLYGMMSTQPGFASLNIKKMAIKSADNQQAIVEDVKERVNQLLVELKNAVTKGNDW